MYILRKVLYKAYSSTTGGVKLSLRFEPLVVNKVYSGEIAL